MQKKSIMELNRLSPEEFKKSKKTPLVIILDNVRSALNVGSAFRTSDAFAIESLILCGICAKPPHREILKTALGAENSVDWHYFENTSDAIHSYRNKGYKIFAIEQAMESIGLHEYNWNHEPICIIFGNEVDGVSDEIMDMVDGCLEIPQYGTKHSLNISVSMGIVVWELFKKNKFEK